MRCQRVVLADVSCGGSVSYNKKRSQIIVSLLRLTAEGGHSAAGGWRVSCVRGLASCVTDRQNGKRSVRLELKIVCSMVAAY